MENVISKVKHLGKEQEGNFMLLTRKKKWEIIEERRATQMFKPVGPPSGIISRGGGNE